MSSNIKAGKTFHHIVSGGAGVGKSKLISAIFQNVERILPSEPGPIVENRVLLVAPTGKAAHNIDGMTAHQVFHLNKCKWRIFKFQEVER